VVTIDRWQHGDVRKPDRSEGTIRRYNLSFNRVMRVVMTVFLCGPRQCRVQLDGDRLRVRMGLAGWAFAGSVPRRSIKTARTVRGPVLAWGAHGWRGRWLVNGSSRGLVQLTIEPPARGRCLFVPIKLKELTLSLEQPDQFLDDIR
jgi:hypothetical protein